MQDKGFKEYLVLGICIALGLVILGHELAAGLIKFKQYERTVTVKGLSEREMPADIALWPIQFTAADNDLGKLYGTLQTNTERIVDFLTSRGFTEEEITVSAPAINDKLAQQYGDNAQAPLRYTATQTVTVYTTRVDAVRATTRELVELGREGIVFTGNVYENRTEYLFTGLNELKPDMVEEATRQARVVAQKFAADSHSRLGKIKTARQGQFSINDRDKNTPYIKKVRVVSTVEYYLSD